MHAAFGDHWAAVASTFTNESSVLNEPFNLSPFASDSKELLPLYMVLHERIRQHDQEAIIFYEPHVLNGQLGVASDFPPGGPGGVADNGRQALAHQ